MQIALVTETFTPQINGVALTVQGFQTGLLKLGHRVEIVRPTCAGERAGHVPGELRLPGAALPRYPGLRFGWPAGQKLRQHWRSTNRPDAVYIATEGPLGWSALHAAKALGLPVSTGFHTRFDDYMARYGAGWLAPVAFAWLRRFHNHGDATLVPTRQLQEMLTARGFTQVRWLPRAVDAQAFHPNFRSAELRREWGVDEAGFIAVHVGRIAAEKNLELAVRAFRAIQQHQPNARFVLVGDGPERERLAAANPDFIFTGMQRGSDLAAHFASADLFLFPSLSETFGNVTLEAMASGIPTVAYDYGAAHEHLRDGEHGCTLARDDEAGFIAAAEQLVSDAALRHRMGIAAREAVAAMSPESVYRVFAQMLQELAQAAPVRSAA